MNRPHTYLAALLLGSITVVVVASDFESPLTLEAAKILPAEIVEGPHHKVDSEVINDGFMNTYRIASDFGRFQAYGSPQLAIRLREIEALAELDELSKTEVYANAVKEGALRSAKAIETFAEKPVETVKGVPQGVKKLFGRTKRAVEDGYETAKGVVSGDVEESEGGDGEQDQDERSKAEKAGDVTSEYAKQYFGVNAAQRRWSQKLRVDPYTTNEVLIKAIKQVAKIDSAGRFTVRLAPIPKIPGAGTITQVNNLVWTMDSYELREYNRKRLVEAGASADSIETFYQSEAFSPTRQTLLITALLSLGATENFGQALLQASTAESDDEARFFVAAGQMLAWFHENESPIARLLPGTRAFVAATEDDRVVFMVPVDYMSWTPEVAEAAQRINDSGSGDAGSRQLWLLGEASQRCRAELEGLGWKVETGLGVRLYEAAQAAAEANSTD